MGRPSRTLLLLLPTLLFLFPALLAGEAITFNPALNGYCTVELGGCDFTNASIWLPQQVPGPNDTATITGANKSTFLYLSYNSPATYSLGNLTVDQALFVITNVTSLTVVGSVTVEAGANLVLKNSTLTASSNSSQLSLAVGSSIRCEQSTVVWPGTSQIYGILNLDGGAQLGYVTAYAPSSATFGAVVQVYSLNVTAGENVSFPNGLVASGAISAANTSSIYVEQAYSGQIILMPGSFMQIYNVSYVVISGTNTSSPISGGGSLSILLSNKINITAVYTAVFAGNLTITGITPLFLTNLNVPNLNFVGIVDLVADGLVFDSNTTISSMYIFGAGVVIGGNVVVQGMTVVNSSSLSITGSLVAPSIVLNGTSEVLLGGVLQTNLVVPAGTQLHVTSSKGTVVGNVENQGTVVVATKKELEVIGNYVQFPNATLQVTLGDDGTSTLAVVNGSIALNGAVQFTITDKPLVKSEKYLIASADYGINGTFVGSATALKGSAIDRDLSVEYESNKAYIVYSFHVKDVEIWMWVVISIVVVLLIISTIAVIIKCRKRANYEML